MTGNMTDYAVATGEFIEEWLDDHDMTAAELARRTGCSRKHISTVLAGARVTPEFASKLELVTHVPAERWLALEGQYRADVERLGLQEKLAGSGELLDSFQPSLTVLSKLGIIEGDMRRPGRLMMQLMSFFRVGSPDAMVARNLIPDVAFLRSTVLDVNVASLATWLRLAQIQAVGEPPTSSYSPSGLQSVLPELRPMSRDLDTDPAAGVRKLAEVGVRVVLLEEIKGCRAYGATFWDEYGPVVVLSARGKRDGVLWFTLFHELGHVLLHPRQLFLEDSDDESTNAEGQEAEANSFATQWLVPDDRAREAAALRNEAEVVNFAQEIGVSPGVVMQYLHHHKYWKYWRGQDLYQRVNLQTIGKTA